MMVTVEYRTTFILKIPEGSQAFPIQTSLCRLETFKELQQNLQQHHWDRM